MQYKIPVQIENDDPIFLGLSLKQLIFVIIGGAIAYYIFKGLTSVGIPGEIAAILPIFILMIVIAIVLFKHSGMTFIPFVLNALRLYLNAEPKKWEGGIDSFTPLEVGYVTKNIEKKQTKYNINSKKDKLKTLEDKLNKI